jgi:hypothetical protein
MIISNTHVANYMLAYRSAVLLIFLAWPAIADENLILNCTVSAVRICAGGIEDHQCQEWRSPKDDETVFGIAQIDDNWELFGHQNIKLELISDSDEFLNRTSYRFEYDSNSGKGWLAVSRTSGSGMWVRVISEKDDALHSLFSCQKVENKW